MANPIEPLARGFHASSELLHAIHEGNWDEVAALSVSAGANGAQLTVEAKEALAHLPKEQVEKIVAKAAKIPGGMQVMKRIGTTLEVAGKSAPLLIAVVDTALEKGNFINEDGSPGTKTTRAIGSGLEIAAIGLTETVLTAAGAPVVVVGGATIGTGLAVRDITSSVIAQENQQNRFQQDKENWKNVPHLAQMLSKFADDPSLAIYKMDGKIDISNPDAQARLDILISGEVRRNDDIMRRTPDPTLNAVTYGVLSEGEHNQANTDKTVAKLAIKQLNRIGRELTIDPDAEISASHMVNGEGIRRATKKYEAERQTAITQARDVADDFLQLEKIGTNPTIDKQTANGHSRHVQVVEKKLGTVEDIKKMQELLVGVEKSPPYTDRYKSFVAMAPEDILKTVNEHRKNPELIPTIDERQRQQSIALNNKLRDYLGLGKPPHSKILEQQPFTQEQIVEKLIDLNIDPKRQKYALNLIKEAAEAGKSKPGDPPQLMTFGTDEKGNLIAGKAIAYDSLVAVFEAKETAVTTRTMLAYGDKNIDGKLSPEEAKNLINSYGNGWVTKFDETKLIEGFKKVDLVAMAEGKDVDKANIGKLSAPKTKSNDQTIASRDR